MGLQWERSCNTFDLLFTKCAYLAQKWRQLIGYLARQLAHIQELWSLIGHYVSAVQSLGFLINYVHW